MNALGLTILWMSIQIALFSLLGTGIFLLLRRRGPNAATAGAAAVLMLTLLLTALAIGPWPRWSLASLIPKPSASSPVDHKQIKQPDVSLTETDSLPVVELPANTEASALSLWWNALSQQLSSVDTTKAVQLQKIRWWQSWLPLIVIVGAGLAFARLMAGIWALQSVRRKSTPIEDPELLALVRGLAAELETPEVSLRETSLLRSAATIGWRHPLLLLPADWRSWTPIERRAVVAHELAHVARRDYLLVLVARFASAIHFYQPLVLWLNRQLRLQQELAADTRAAALLGSRQEYLTTLAQMALRADEQPIPWAARAFLPGNSALIKRVAWLKRNDTRADQSLGRKTRIVLIGFLAMLALAVAGIRGPNDSSRSVAAEPEPAKPKAGEIVKFDSDAPEYRSLPLEYVPADAIFVMAVNPALTAKTSAGVAKLLPFVDSAVNFEKMFGIPLMDLDDFQLIIPSCSFLNELQATPDELRNQNIKALPSMATIKPVYRIILRSRKPQEWKAILEKIHPRLESRQFETKTYYHASSEWPLYFIANDRTLIMSTEEDIKKIVKGEKLMDLLQLPTITASPCGAWVQLKAIPLQQLWPRTANPLHDAIRPLIDNVAVAMLSLDPEAKNGQTHLVTQMKCNSAEGAKKVATTLDALRTLTINMIDVDATDIAKNPSSFPPSAGGLIGFAKNALEVTKIASQESYVIASTNVDLKPQIITNFLTALPDVESAREQARRAISANNLKQLADALHDYHAANKHFPAPTIIRPDGKPKHSWRVALLPYLHRADLYEQYRLDEPWDSKHNLELLDKMPLQFRYPGSDPKSTSTAYFMPTGKGTIGGNERGTKIKQITDGSSNTIALVEAKRDIYWTKPEDIEIELEKPLPKFGGYRPDGTFGVAFADGKVQALPDDLNTAVLKALFTIEGGETVELPDNVK